MLQLVPVLQSMSCLGGCEGICGAQVSMLQVLRAGCTTHWVSWVDIKVFIGTELCWVDVYGCNHHICMLPAVCKWNIVTSS